MTKKLLRITTASVSLDVLLKGQLTFLNQYYEVVGLASGEEGLKKVSEREGIRTVEVNMKREISLLADLASLWAMIRTISREKPFIVHASTPKGSLLSILAAWLCRVPHRIYTVTGLRFETASGSFRQLLIAVEKLTCRLATRVIPEGEGVKRTLLQEKITRKPLTVILHGNINGIDLGYFQRSSEVEINASALRKKVFTFCYVGRMTRDKGINELIHAFAQLHKTCADVHLLLVGPLEQELDPISETALEMLHDHPAITYTGFQEDVRPFLAASDAFVFPSYREGFPNVVMQAAAMGLPSIVTDISGSNEIIIQGQNGIIIPPRDQNALLEAMKYFAEHQDTVASMAASCRPLIASRYEQKMVWEAILHMYQSLEKIT